MQPNNYNIKKIVFFGVLFLIVACVIGFLILRPKNSPSSSGTSSKNLFPFGQSGQTGANQSIPDSGTIAQSGSIPTGTSPLSLAGTQALREIANYPVTGYFASTQNITTSTPELDPKTGATIYKTLVTPTDMIMWNAKETGVLFGAQVTDGAILETQKTTTLVPNAQEIWFGNSGNSVVYRTYDQANNTISSLVGSFPKSMALPYCTTTLTSPLKRGSTGKQVVALQKYITFKLNLGLATDGVLGLKTLQHMQDLQTKLGISPLTGSYDATTRAAINADCTAILAANANSATKPIALSSAFMNSGILRGIVSPDGTQIFFLQPTTAGVVGIVANANGTNQKKVFTSPVTEWMPQWVNKTTISMTTLASDQAAGYMYFLNPTTGAFQKILGPINGLTTLTDPTGQEVLYSASTNQGFTTSIYSIPTGATNPLTLTTLPEKCVWQNSKMLYCAVPQSITAGDYPDAWYQGVATFTDNVWSINTVTKVTKELISPSQNFDIVHLGMGPDAAYLYFINKSDGTLWSLKNS